MLKKRIVPCLDIQKRIAAEINIPFTVGGGISTLDDAAAMIRAGADKVSINSAAVRRPELLSEIANEFGSQCVVLAIDTKKEGDTWWTYVRGGRTKTDKKTLDWAQTAEALGAGEILLTSMNSDGTKAGFSLEITEQVSAAVSIPVIASGGAGSMAHFKDVFTKTEASAGLAASIFHYEEIAIPDLKGYLRGNEIPVRV